MTAHEDVKQGGSAPLDGHVRPLVERLRVAALPGTRRNALDEEAAAEIERLRAALAELVALEEPNNQPYAEYLDRRRAAWQAAHDVLRPNATHKRETL